MNKLTHYSNLNFPEHTLGLITIHISARKAKYKLPWQKRTPAEALSCNLNSKDNFEFHIKRDIKYRTIYRISQELIKL